MQIQIRSKRDRDLISFIKNLVVLRKTLSLERYAVPARILPLYHHTTKRRDSFLLSKSLKCHEGK